MTWWGSSTTGGSVVGGGGSGSGELASDIIDQAKTLVDDDHESDKDWIDESRWLRWLNWERKSLSLRSVKMGVIRPPVLETTFTGHTTTITDAMAIVSVSCDTTGQMLKPAQSRFGSEPYYPGPAGYSSGDSTTWSAYANGNSFTVELYPRHTTNTYRVRYVPAISYVTAVNQLVLVPIGWERRIVYGMVRHALLKESGRSAELRDLIKEADAEIGMEITGRGDGPRVRNSRDRQYNPDDPRFWVFA
jgi:hypothetical protein